VGSNVSQLALLDADQLPAASLQFFTVTVCSEGLLLSTTPVKLSVPDVTLTHQEWTVKVTLREIVALPG